MKTTDKKRVRVKLTELKNADVHFVSFVDRACSRLPFRVTKRSDEQENSMIDLSNIRRVLKGETGPAPAVVTALVTNDLGDADMSKVMEAIKAQGFSVDKVTKGTGDAEGTVIFAQTDAKEPEGKMVRLSDNLVAVVKGFDAYAGSYYGCYPADGSDEPLDFNDSVTARSFFPGVETACQVMGDAVRAAVYKADDPTSAASAITDIVKKFSDYMEGMTKALPVKAFKMDAAITEIAKQVAVKKNESVTTETKSPDGTTVTTTPEKTEVEKETKPTTTPEAKPEPTNTPEAKPAETTQKSDVEKLMEMLSGVSDSLKTLATKSESLETSLKAVQKAQETSDEKLAESVKKFDTATTKLNTTVLGAPQAGDNPTSNQNNVRKGEKEEQELILDTGMQRRNRR